MTGPETHGSFSPSAGQSSQRLGIRRVHGESSFRVDCTVNCVSDESAINLRGATPIPVGNGALCLSRVFLRVPTRIALSVVTPLFSPGSSSFPRGEETRPSRPAPLPPSCTANVAEIVAIHFFLSFFFFLPFLFGESVWETTDKFNGTADISFHYIGDVVAEVENATRYLTTLVVLTMQVSLDRCRYLGVINCR